MDNWQPILMYRSENTYNLSARVSFNGYNNLSNEDLDISFNFAYDMAYGELHRNYRSGGTHERRNTEIFINALQGKLSEVFLRNLFIDAGIQVNDVDTGLYARGQWDAEDLSVFNGVGTEVKITIKSTKNYGNLMLLETKDWNSRGEYIPNGPLGVYDIFCLVRVDFALEEILRKKRLYFSDYIDKNDLRSFFNLAIFENQLRFDFPGFLYKEDIEKVIRNNQIIHRGEYLNKTPMDADNYYIQSGNMRNFDDLVDFLKSH